jgi:DNA-binding GntR family transcriptional regulator
VKPLIQEQALTEKVRDAIVAAIIDGTYQTGERLAQEEIAGRLGVSRQPVSHALNVLKQQGILVELGRKGLTVAPMDPDRLEALYQVRGTLDGLAARLTAGRVGRGEISANDLRPLADLIDKQLNPATAGSFSQRVDADVAFHLALYRLSGNPVIEDMTAPHWVHFRRSMQEVLNDPGAYPPVWEQHQAIFDALVAADAAAAEKLCLDHVQTASAKAANRLRTTTPSHQEEHIQ